MKTMKTTKNLLAIAIIAAFFTACKKDEVSQTPSSLDATSFASATDALKRGETGSGHVYLLSNMVAGNNVLEYSRASDGSLTLTGTWPTGDIGTGGGLGSQGAVILGNREGDGDGEQKLLFAVNAGSNSISTFKVRKSGLQFLSTVNSGGIRPVSITQSHNLVFVLNAGGDGNISGFKLRENGSLQAIPNSSRPLSTTSSGPAEIAFVNDSKVLVITEKATNMITSYTVNKSGMPGAMHTLASANNTPFGFAVGGDKIYVTEAAGGMPGASTVSSYRISENGAISLITGPVSAGQTAACWAVITDNNKYVYAANTGSGTISSFDAGYSGSISVKEAVAASAGAGAADAALSHGSKYLYVRNGGSTSISAYKVSNNGSLSNVQTVTGLPVGTVGIIAD
jgi:6-phosphogluconolactonase